MQCPMETSWGTRGGGGKEQQQPLKATLKAGKPPKGNVPLCSYRESPSPGIKDSSGNDNEKSFPFISEKEFKCLGGYRPLTTNKSKQNNNSNKGGEGTIAARPSTFSQRIL
jgi:hypothetical protein